MASSQASASIGGTPENPILNLVLPTGGRGEKGDKGDKGDGVPTGGSANQIMQKNSSGVVVWVSPTKTLVGLGNVDNTADANKPVSTLQKAYVDALSEKVVGVPVAILRKNLPSVMGTGYTNVPWEVTDKLRGFNGFMGTHTLIVGKTGIYTVSIKLASSSASGLLSMQFKVDGAVWSPATVDAQSTSTAYAKVLSSFDIALEAGDQITVTAKNANQGLSDVECLWTVRYVDTV